MSKYAQIAAMLFNDPLLAEPAAAEMIVRVLAPRLGLSTLVSADGAELSGDQLRAPTTEQEATRWERQYEVTRAGLAVVPVIGELVERSYHLRPQSGLTGYTAIGREVDRAADDDDVKAIAVDIQSPGGTLGALDLAVRIREAGERSGKPIWAMVGSQATSAAYAIATGASRILAARNASIGSIGVIALHADVSKALEKEGVKVTVLRAGQFKAEGNPYEALGKATRERWETRLNDVWGQFIQLVANHRDLDPDAVRDTQAAVFNGPDALELGLIDEIMPVHQGLAALSEHVSPRGRKVPQTREDTLMAKEPGTAETAAPNHDGNALEEARKLGMSSGATTERARIKEILGCAEAEGRMTLAQHLAFNTSMAVKDCQDLLAASAKEIPAALAAAAAPALAARMAEAPNPQVGPDPKASGSDDSLEASMAYLRKLEEV